MNVSFISKQEAANAAVIVVTLEGLPDEMPTLAHECAKQLPQGCLLLILQKGESVSTLSEDQMRESGWVRETN